jgi:DNA-3-methyladenine glycosylase
VIDLPLPREFYARPVVEVARELLGCVLIRRLGGLQLAGRIVETEAYAADGDESSHAFRGRTARNAAMFGPPGHAYVYRSYGIHYCLNVVTTHDGGPARAVLIRAMEALEGVAAMRQRRPGCGDADLLRGPGNLCRALAIDLTLDGADLSGNDVAIMPAEAPTGPVVTTTRIGISRSVELPWRFYVQGSSSVSRRDRAAEAAIGRSLHHAGPATSLR